jgi:hypothetical protein
MVPIWKKAVYEKYPELVADLEVSDEGVVRKCTTKKIFKTQIKDNQLFVDRLGRRIFLRYLVPETFVGPIKEGETVAFKDGNRNNVTLANLQYVKKETNIAPPIVFKKEEAIALIASLTFYLKKLEELLAKE